MKTQKARNIQVNYNFKSFSGEKQHHSVSQYMMAPESSDLWDEYRSFNRGDKTTVQSVVDLAYWAFLGKQGTDVEPHLLPAIPFKFDRKTKDAVVTLQDGCSLQVWVDIDISE